VEFYSATKKNEILSFASKWMELENIILSEVSQAQKAKNHMFSIICGLQTPNKRSNIIGHGSHAKGRTCTGGIGKGKET
jgi:glutamyl-tRNA reductase